MAKTIRIDKVEGATVTTITELPDQDAEQVLRWALRWRQGHERRGAQIMPIPGGMRAWSPSDDRLDIFWTQDAPR